MRCSQLIVIPMLLFCFSCKKPRAGYWEATFTDQASYGDNTRQRMRFDHDAEKFTIVSGAYNMWGELRFDKKKSAITDGLVYFENFYNYQYTPPGITNIHYGDSITTTIYSNFKGTMDRETIFGTYAYSKVNITYDGNVHDTIGPYTGTGTFELRWQEKIPRKEK